MSNEDWPKGWYQDEKPSGTAPEYDQQTRDLTAAAPGLGGETQPGAGSGWTAPGAGREPATVPPPGIGAGAAASGWQAPDGARSAWPAQPPPVRAPGGPGGPGGPFPGGRPGRHGGRRWRFWGQPGRRGRRIALIAGTLVAVLIIAFFGTYFWVNGKLDRSVTLPAFTGQSAGQNWLIVGSDTRKGLTRTEIDQLHVGFVGANASDSLMLLHMGTGRPVLISIPRDSYVPIPGYGENKINAALAFGGPTLLVKTVEEVTGLRIDHYMGIGFGGLVSVVNTVGGVRICLPTALDDPNSGVHLKAGCQNLNGTQALAFVRDRHSFATSDLQRIQDQRAFLKALLSKATSAGVYLNPFVAVPFASTAAGSISVDKGTSLYDLTQAAMALRSPLTGTVPIANANYQTNAGDSVLWNQTEALELFRALQAGKPVPAGLLSGTKIG
jgi:LCP family protein required for cell wall assembly